MRPINIFFIIIILLTLFNNKIYTIDVDESPTILPFTQAIHQRFYFATRLENPINMLHEIKNECSSILLQTCKEKDLIPLENLKKYQFKHSRTLKCIDSLKNENALTSFFHLWQDVAGYKYLGDQVFINEFITLLIFFTKKVITIHVKLSSESLELLNKAQEKALNGKRPIKLDFIAACVEQYYLNRMKKPFDVAAFNAILNQETKSIACKRVTKNSDKIFERFYHIKRLTKPVEKLLAFEDKKLFFQNSDAKKFDHSLNFKNDRVQSIIKQMEENKCSEPLKRAWRDVRRFKSVEDDQYLKDVLKMLFASYKNILTKKLPTTSQAKAEESLKTIEYLYNEVEKMSSDNILNAIDMLTIELEGFLEIQNTSCMSRLKKIKESRAFWAATSFLTAGGLIYLKNNFFNEG